MAKMFGLALDRNFRYHNHSSFVENEFSRYRVTVVVLGDLGRSPRMLNHAVALAADGAHVSLVGYLESPLPDAVSADSRICLYGIHNLRRAPEHSARLRFYAVTALRVAWLAVQAIWLLLVRTPRPDAILVQNPPCLPTLPVAWLAARLRGSRFVVDWHNFGYSLLAARLGSSHRIVRLSRFSERLWGRLADANFCVSRAMRGTLVDQFLLSSSAIVRDRPTQLLPLLPATSRAAVARNLLATAGIPLPENAALAICPTSWTADEDIDLLLAGLLEWDQHTLLSPSIRLFVLITGCGPLRDAFEARLSTISWCRVVVRTAFLDPSTYRELLVAAHLGFCLHRSASGVDLPMKLVDLFGARTPACVLDYGDCLAEQIQPGRTALTFRNSHELAHRIDEALEGFPHTPLRLEQMQRDIEISYAETWLQSWAREAAPTFRRLLNSN